MKKITRITIFLFSLLILVPVFFMNFKGNQVSLTDNRMLAENPFKAESREPGERIPAAVERYISDRIGFRDEIILSYTLLNDKLFGEMVHPFYSYGKDGYIFGGILDIQYDEYHEDFANMVADLQTYCNDRGIPFLFVFDPSKTTVLSEYLPEGVNYSADWVNTLMEALDERGVNYVNNTQMLIDKTAQGEVVFNQKFDANHWNELGAFYGVNEILKELQKDLPNITLNTKDEFDISKKVEETLLLSEFPINEEVPVFTGKETVEEVSGEIANELELDVNYRNFGIYHNEEKLEQKVPSILSFQGSYLNHIGLEFMENALGEYVVVHNYQNIINAPYYINLFQPEAVVFEVAEYTLENDYFSQDGMKAINWNKPLKDREAVLEETDADMSKVNVPEVEKGKSLTILSWNLGEIIDHAWILMGDKEYDMMASEEKDGVYTLTIQNEIYEEYKDSFEIVVEKDKTLTRYSF